MELPGGGCIFRDLPPGTTAGGEQPGHLCAVYQGWWLRGLRRVGSDRLLRCPRPTHVKIFADEDTGCKRFRRVKISEGEDIGGDGYRPISMSEGRDAGR